MTNVEEFFRLAERDPSIQKKLSDGLAVYPGSLEVREAVAENVLLPVAEALGLPFLWKNSVLMKQRKSSAV